MTGSVAKFDRLPALFPNVQIVALNNLCPAFQWYAGYE